MKVYARVNSVEKKEIVSEKDGKREKKILYVAKVGEIGGMRFSIKSEEPLKELVVGSTVSLSINVAQAKLDTEPREAKKEATPQ